MKTAKSPATVLVVPVVLVVLVVLASMCVCVSVCLQVVVVAAYDACRPWHMHMGHETVRHPPLIVLLSPTRLQCGHCRHYAPFSSLAPSLFPFLSRSFN